MLQIGFKDFIDESILSLEPRPFIKLLNIYREFFIINGKATNMRCVRMSCYLV